MTGRSVPTALLCALALLAGACGTAGGSLPPAAPCPTPTPVASTGRSAVQRYFTAVREADRDLRAPTDQFLARWPSRKFSRKQEFREELAAAADTARCVAERWRDLQPPDERFTAYDEAVDIVLEGYIADMADGHEAAETRNVSKFRDWLAAVDRLPGALEATLPSIPAGSPQR